MATLRIPLLLTAAALALRLTVAIGLATDEPDDGRLYSQLAHNVLTAGVYSIDAQPPLTPTYIRVPGYPLFIATVYRVFGDRNDTAVRAAQAIIDTATCWLVALLAWAWSPSSWDARRRRRAGLVAGIAAAVCPFPLIYPATLLTETLALCLGTLTVYLATRALWPAVSATAQPRRLALTWVAVGLGAGSSALVRPENGLYLAVAGGMLLLVAAREFAGLARQERSALVKATIVRGALLAAGFAAVVTPWTIRNAIVFDSFEPLNPQSVSMPDEFVPTGYHTWVRTWIDHPRYIEKALFDLDTEPIHVSDLPDAAFDSAEERARVEALLDQYDTPAPDTDRDEQGRLAPGGMTPAIDAGFAQLARERIARHPFRYYVGLPIRRALALWFTTHADFYPFSGYLLPWSDLDPDLDQQVWLPFFLALLLAWTVAGWGGAWRLWRAPGSRHVVVFVALLIVPRLALLSWLPNPEPRYTVEFFPLVSALAGCFIAGFGESRA